MIECWVGIDGGGSKTRFLAVDAAGRQIGESVGGPTFHRQDGVDQVIAVLREGLAAVTIGVKGEVAACFGMTGYGESPSADAAAAQQITQALPDIKLTFANDVHCAWAGAGALAPGICLIMGTGA
ncbi:MAG: hypothetical protein LBE83_10415, partial [Propionibacteriaceae bacterium]|nr:hypothetical protein [Propionibacteriaceae bacterium]